jgi:OmpA-OmpF porin, OOP family
MRKKVMEGLLVASLLLCVVTAGKAQEQDAKGSQDHPLITRYPGCSIQQYKTAGFDQFVLGLAAPVGGTFKKSMPVEGKITRIGYGCPKERSALEIYRNFESALKRAGFVPLFTCALGACGSGDPHQNVNVGPFETWNYDVRYHMTAKLARQEGDVYVHIGVWQADRPYAEIDVIEVKPMESDLVTVNAASLANDITKTGHASVYGILFDTGKADVKPESDATLAEISKLLQQDASLKLYVVGHTDNVGTLASNMDLSKRRADAVVKVLTTKYNVAAARLSAQGDGPTAPVASNDSEEGRAKNRRVELVKQ